MEEEEEGKCKEKLKRIVVRAGTGRPKKLKGLGLES